MPGSQVYALGVIFLEHLSSPSSWRMGTSHSSWALSAVTSALIGLCSLPLSRKPSVASRLTMGTDFVAFLCSATCSG